MTKNRTKLTRREVVAGLSTLALAPTTAGCGAPEGVEGEEPSSRDAEASELASEGMRALDEIETIVVLCMENRSFDHALGSLSLLEGRGVDGLRGGETNNSSRGDSVGVFRLDDLTVADPPHSWDACHAQWNGGRNDGFVRAHEGPNEREVMGYHVRAQLPVTYALADAYALADRWFCSVLGPTWPNRFYLHGGTALGQRGNAPVLGFSSIFARLARAGVQSRNYYHDVPWALGGYGKLLGLSRIEDFFEDAASGRLPPFCVIDPQFFGPMANDDHPDHDVRLGQALIGSVYAALARSPQWGRCLFVLTYDEHGGFFDHVPPPTVVDAHPDFRTMGFRVPSLVVGPLVRRGVVSTVLEHTSVVATVARRYRLPELNARVTTANDLSVCLDPARVGAPHRAVELPRVELDLDALRERTRTFDASRSSEHPELAASLRTTSVPDGVDRRAEGLDVQLRVLRYGERLGAVRL